MSFFSTKLRLLVGFAIFVVFLLSPVFSGPAIPPIEFKDDEVFENISQVTPASIDIEGGKGGTPDVLDGKLILPFDKTGYVFMDLSDPYNPKKTGLDPGINALPDSHPKQPNSHTFGFARVDGKVYASTMVHTGTGMHDWTDLDNPKFLGYYEDDILLHNNYLRPFWQFIQYPYVYLAGKDQGILIVDASDPENLELAARIPNEKTGGFDVSVLFAVGNYLVVTSNQGSALLDISDPINPVLVSGGNLLVDKNGKVNRLKTDYASIFNGWKMWSAGERHVDFTDPFNPESFKLNFSAPKWHKSKGGYAVIQDGHLFQGHSASYRKIDYVNDTLIGESFWIKEGEKGADMDFVFPLGNLWVLGHDGGDQDGYKFAVHDKNPDTRGPEVNMVVPVAGSVHQASTTRIGLGFTEQVELMTVDPSTFIVRAVGGEPLEGYYSSQAGIVNFTPKQPLSANTEYEIFIPEGGIKDYSGNGASAFSSRFSTGGTVTIDPSAQYRIHPISEINPMFGNSKGFYGLKGFDVTGKQGIITRHSSGIQIIQKK